MIHHSGFLYNEDFKETGVYVVALFFFISGYGLENKRLNNKVNVKGLRVSLKKLIVPLVIPIIIYTLLKLTVFHVSPHAFLDSLYKYQIILPYTWFIITLAILYCIFYIIASIDMVNSFLMTFTIIIVVICAIAFALHIQTTYHQAISGFIAGIIYKNYEDFLIQRIKNYRKLSYICIAILLGVVTYYSNNLIGGILYPQVYLLSFIYPILVVMLLGRVNIPKTRVIEFFANISYELYICQGIAFLLMSGFGLPVWQNLICVFLLNIAIAYSSHWLTSKYIMKTI